MISQKLANPFTKNQVGHEPTPPPGNVPDLHKTARDLCRRLVQQVRDSESGVSLLVCGEAGSGKSHLITQVRAELADDPAAFVIRVPLDKAYVGQVWRYVRGQVASELLRKRWHPQAPDLTGLLRIVQNAFPGWSPAGRPGVMGIWGKKGASQDLQEQLGLFAEDNEFAYELRQVLPRLWDPATATLAGDWLRGKTLAEDDLKKLGLPASYPNDFEQEQIARDVVISLCRLAAGKTTLVICFDEIEALLTGGNDTVALRAFTTLATDLIAEPGPRVVVAFIRPDTLVTLRKHVEHSNLQKMSQTEAAIPPLEWEHVVQLVLARLHADPGCRAERGHYPREQYWPFGEEFLRELYAREHLNITPRHVIIACRIEFDRLQKGLPASPGPSAPTPLPGPSPTPPAATSPPPPASVPPVSPPVNPPKPELFGQLWDKRRAHHLTHLHALAFETVVGNGLRWLAGLTAAPFVESDTKDTRLGDVNLIFRPTGPGLKPVGVSFCHQEPQSLWRRLDRLINQSQAAKAHGILGKLVLMRSADAPLSGAAHERIEKIRRGGAVVMLLPKVQLAELAAFQELQSKAQTGGMTDFGKPIAADRYGQWAKENLSAAVKALVSDIFGSEIVPPPMDKVGRPGVDGEQTPETKNVVADQKPAPATKPIPPNGDPQGKQLVMFGPGEDATPARQKTARKPTRR